MITGKSNVYACIKVLLEVISIFLIIIFVFKIIEVLPIGKFENAVLKFRLTGYLVMLLLPVCLIIINKSGLSKYGISLKNANFNIVIALSCFLPSLAIIAALQFLNWRDWTGAFLVVLIQTAVLLIMLYLANRQSTKNANKIKNLIVLCLIILTGGIVQIFAGRTIPEVLLSFIIFFIVTAPAEEIFFRGYVQTKLNTVFGKKFILFGVSFGWGLILASLLFGAMHIFNTYNPLLGMYDVSLPWGLWTTFLGLILGFIREKTGSLIAPVIIHAIINFF